MPRSSRRLASFLAVATVLATVAACSGDGKPGRGSASASEDGENEASDIGVTEDTITLGGHFPLTGVAAAGVREIPLGIEAYLGHVNDHGGVNDRTIEYRYEDDAYDPARTSAVVRELVLEDEVFAIVGRAGRPTHGAVLEFLNDEGVPDLFVSSGSRRWGADPGEHPYSFGWQPDHASEGQVIGRYLAAEFPDATIGLFLQDDESGQEGEAGIRRYVDDDRIVEVQRYAVGNTEVGPQISALAASGADVVVGLTLPTYTALSQLRAAELGFAPQWIYSTVGSDPALVGSLMATLSDGAVPTTAPLEGALTTGFLPTVGEPADEWIRLFRRIWDDQGGKGPLTDHTVYGMSLAYTAVQSLQAAGRNPTREGLIEALEQAGGDFRGPVLAPFRYSADSHLGAGGMAIRRVVGGVLQELRPVTLTGIGDAGPAEWTGERAGPPENGIPDEQVYE